MAKKVYIAEFDANGEPYFRKLDEVEKKTIQSSQRMSKAIDGIKNSFVGIASTTALIAFLDDSMKAFIEEEKAVRKLESSVGKITTKLKDYASVLQSTTTFADDEILNAMSLISIYVKQEGQIKALTKATLDFAYAKDMDLATAAELVAKTIGTETNALSKHGIVIDETATSQEKFNQVLNQLSLLFEGQASNALDTYGGKLENIKNQLSDVQEEIGMRVLPIWLKLNEAILYLFENGGLMLQGVVSPTAAIELYLKDRLPARNTSSVEEESNIRPSTTITPEMIQKQRSLYSSRNPKLKKDKRKLPTDLGNVYMRDFERGALNEFIASQLSTQPVFDPDVFAQQMHESLAKTSGIDDLLKQWAEEAAEEFYTRFNAVVDVANSVRSIFNVTADSFVGKLISGVETAAQILQLINSLSIAITGGGLLGFAKGGSIVNRNGNVSITSIPSFAGGGSFMVPPGYSRDNYPILVKSGERVDITPVNQMPHITELLRQINNSIQASTMTAVKGKSQPIVVNLSLDGRSLTRQVLSNQNSLTKAGANFNEL